MRFDSESQCGQDAWVASCHGMARNLRYLDVGAGLPVAISNTVQLERCLGWTGHLIDIETADQLAAERAGNVIHRDALALDWNAIADSGRFAYLSLDLEPAETTLRALLRILAAGVQFDLATIEHDAYRFGYDIARAMRAMLEARGYVRVAEDVVTLDGDGRLVPLEDWWVDPATMNVGECRFQAAFVTSEAIRRSANP